mmetsp:Transcript_21106/g.32210  ORF Transcript_21106/g.32210 Transcript_21106/m.32210 type:complete len:211 (-) Transcript_21106:1506-2138(-)
MDIGPLYQQCRRRRSIITSIIGIIKDKGGTGTYKEPDLRIATDAVYEVQCCTQTIQIIITLPGDQRWQIPGIHGRSRTGHGCRGCRRTHSRQQRWRGCRCSIGVGRRIPGDPLGQRRWRRLHTRHMARRRTDAGHATDSIDGVHHQTLLCTKGQTYVAGIEVHSIAIIPIPIVVRTIIAHIDICLIAAIIHAIIKNVDRTGVVREAGPVQ